MTNNSSELKLAGAVAVVTGAASGIGAALAERLAARGAQLVLVDITPDPLQAIADRFDATAVVADVSNADDVERLAAKAPNASVVCLNAGVTSTQQGAPWEAPPAEWDRVFRVNVGGVVNGLRAFMPRLLARTEPSGILITASLAGLATWPGGGPYAASKHAAVAIAEQTALALADSSVRVSLLCPALVRTGMSEVGDDPLDVADAALAGLSARRFVILPDEWRRSIAERGERLSTGVPPVVPQPT
jgi:NAD(P)-dependent dehydrogenase (short-subunit alcohol dehydrogenase family)